MWWNGECTPYFNNLLPIFLAYLIADRINLLNGAKSEKYYFKYWALHLSTLNLNDQKGWGGKFIMWVKFYCKRLYQKPWFLNRNSLIHLTTFILGEWPIFYLKNSFQYYSFFHIYISNTSIFFGNIFTFFFKVFFFLRQFYFHYSCHICWLGLINLLFTDASLQHINICKRLRF